MLIYVQKKKKRKLKFAFMANNDHVLFAAIAYHSRLICIIILMFGHWWRQKKVTRKAGQDTLGQNLTMMGMSSGVHWDWCNKHADVLLVLYQRVPCFRFRLAGQQRWWPHTPLKTLSRLFLNMGHDCTICWCYCDVFTFKSIFKSVHVCFQKMK